MLVCVFYFYKPIDRHVHFVRVQFSQIKIIEKTILMCFMQLVQCSCSNFKTINFVGENSTSK